MKLQLDNEIFKWLASLNVIAPSPKFKVLSNGKYELDELTTRVFENGLKFADLIKYLFPVIMEENNPLPLKTLQSLKDQNTPASRLYNWNILYEILKKMGVNLDPEIKSLLVKGDLPMINEFLKDIFENISNRLERMSAASSAKSNISTKNYEFRLISQDSGLLKIHKREYNNPDPDMMNLEQISKNLPLEECRSLLEILLVSLIRNLDLKPKQVVALLSNGNKYLAHVLVKGVKGNYDPLVLWLQELYSNMQYVLPFLTQEDLLIPVMLQVVKPALLSKSSEVTSWGCRIISHLCYELANLELLAPAWEWFCKENGGLNACILCLKRNCYMREGIASVLSQISRFNLAELLTVEVRKFIGNPLELLEFIHNIVHPLVESSILKEGILKEGVLDCWIELAFKSLESSAENKVNAIAILVDIWIIFPNYIEETENMAINILAVLKKGTREKIQGIRVMSIVLLFKLLEYLAKSKNPYAPILYKTLTFSFIENHSELILREVYCRNFENIFQAFPSIPVDILADPLIKQVQASDKTSYFINIFDFDLLSCISRHPKLQVKIGVLLLDLMIKIYLNSLIWNALCKRVIGQILDRFFETPVFQEYIKKMFEVLIETFRVSERKRKFPMKTPIVFNEESEVEIQNSQQRALIIDILKEILSKHSNPFNNFAKDPILKLFNSIKQSRKIEHKGVLTLLQLLGNPQNEAVSEAPAKEIGVQIDIPEPKTKVFFDNNTTASIINIDKSEQRSSFLEKNDELFLENEQLFMEKNQIGIKEKKGFSFEKNKTMMKTKANMRVIEDLERLRIKKLEEALKKQIEEEEKKIKEEIAKKTLKKKLEKLGVFKTEKPAIVEKKEETNNISKTFDLEEKKQINLDVYLIDWDLEEDRDREAINITIKKGSRVLRFLFKKFSNSTNQAKKQEFFTDLKQKFETISTQDIWRMLKELGLDSLCTKDQVSQLIKLMNVRLFNRGDTKNLDFDGFSKFFGQFTMNFFQEGNLDLLFLEIEKNYKEVQGFYDEKDDRETLELNKLLKEKPEAEIPDGFKKIYEKTIDYNHNISFELSRQLKESYLISYNILHDILANSIEVSIIEPNSQFSLITKAKRKLRDLSMNKRENPIQKTETIIGKGQINALRRMKSKQDIDNSNNKNMKNDQIEQNNIRLSKENLDKIDTIRSHSQGIQRKRSISGKNRAEEDRNKQKFLDEMKKKENEIKRKQRQEEVESKLKELKEKKKDQEERKIKEDNEQTRLKEEQELKELEKKRKRLEENKKKLKEFKEKQESEKKRLASVEKTEKEKKEESKKKETEEFLKKQNEKLKQNFEEKKKERSDEIRKKKEVEAKEKSKEIDRKRNIAQTLEKERVNREKSKKIRQEIKELQKKEKMVEVFSKYKEELTNIYDYYIENTELSLDVPYVKDNLQFKGFMNFAVEFQLSPQILNFEKMQLVYRSTTKDKQLADNIPIGVNFSEFEQILLRIAIKGKKWFDILGENNNNINGENDKKEPEEAKEDVNWNGEETSGISKEKIDDYEKIQETDEKTIEGLMKYLDFPMEKSKLRNKLKDLKNKHDKVLAPRDKMKAFANKLTEKKRDKSVETHINNQNAKIQNNENKKHSNKKKGYFFKKLY